MLTARGDITGVDSGVSLRRLAILPADITPPGAAAHVIMSHAAQLQRKSERRVHPTAGSKKQ